MIKRNIFSSIVLATAVSMAATGCAPTADESPERQEAAAEEATTAAEDSTVTLSGPEGPAGTAFWDITETPEEDADAGVIHALQERTDAPPGGQGWNMIYTSEIEPGNITFVSGEIFVPTAPSEEPRDVVLWNHETTGLSDQCAPSRRTVDEMRIPGLQELLDMGNIVVMSDYPGQGLPGPTYYMSGHVNSRASLDALKALHDVPELELTGNFVQYGWSQGGQTSMQAEAIAAEYAPDFELLGTGLIAPAVRIKDLTERSMQHDELAGYVISTLPGIQAAYPELTYGDFLTDEAMEKLPDLSFGCWDIWETGSTLDEPYTESALQNGTDWAEAMEEIDDFTPTGSAPFVIYQGDADNTTPVELTLREVEHLCDAGSEVEYIEFPDLDHVPVVPEAAKAFPTWAQERFNGETASNDCN